MKRNEDGSFSICGWEKCERFPMLGNYKIYHQAEGMCEWRNILEYPEQYVEHDRRDIWLGMELPDGTKVFENDIVIPFSRIGRGFRQQLTQVVHYSELTMKWYPRDLPVIEKLQVVGIKGIDDHLIDRWNVATGRYEKGIKK